MIIFIIFLVLPLAAGAALPLSYCRNPKGTVEFDYLGPWFITEQHYDGNGDVVNKKINVSGPNFDIEFAKAIILKETNGPDCQENGVSWSWQEIIDVQEI